MKPNLNIFGIQETTANKNKFVPHYKVLATRLYQPTRLTLFNPKSVMFTREVFGGLDFWNLDSDFTYAEDALSFNEMLNYSSNHHAYFQKFLKVMRIAHGCNEEQMLDVTDWNKNRAHFLDIVSSMLICDVVMVSPVLKKRLFEHDLGLGNILSDRALATLERKMLVLPPPDLYKFEPTPSAKSFKKLTFLWNHRLNADKNPKSFFNIISKLHEAHPDIPVSIIVLSSLKASQVMPLVPHNIQKFIEQRPFLYDDEAYSKAFADSNVTIGTSLVESYGISILESAKHGLAVFNLPCNKAYIEIIGSGSTCKEKEMPEKLARLFKDKAYRDSLLKYTQQRLAKIDSRTTYVKKLEAKLKTVMDERLDRTSTKSPKLVAVMKALTKKALTKKEVYAVMGWATGKQPINTFWGDYYYGLRKLGAQTTLVNGTLYFHTDVKPTAGQPKPTLFKRK